MYIFLQQINIDCTLFSNSWEFNNISINIKERLTQINLLIQADINPPTFPTSVEPVNDIFATKGCSHKTVPTAGVFFREAVITFTTPGGIPACSANCKKQWTVQYMPK